MNYMKKSLHVLITIIHSVDKLFIKIFLFLNVFDSVSFLFKSYVMVHLCHEHAKIELDCDLPH